MERVEQIPEILRESLEDPRLQVQGSTCVVFRARRDGEPVVLEVFDRVEGATRGAQVLRDAAALQERPHPRLARVLDRGDSEDGPWVLFQDLGEETLADADEVDPLEVMGQLAEALRALGETGLVHGDVRPGNLFRTSGGWVLAGPNLGFDPRPARHEDAARHLGHPQVLSPQVWLLKAYTMDSDWFSWGVIFFWLVEGRLPFSNDELEHAGIQQSLPRYKFERLESRDAQKLIRDHLAYVPQDRAAAISRVEERLAGLEPIPAAPGRPPLERAPLPAPRPRRKSRPVPPVASPPPVVTGGRVRTLLGFVALLLALLLLAR